MISGFDINNIVQAELFVSFEDGATELHYQVPVDNSVQNMLTQMLENTSSELTPPDGAALDTFEVSEKYGSKECLSAPLATEGFDKVRDLYEEENISSNSSALQHSANLEYYYAVFRDSAGRKVVGVRRASQFKAILSAQNRLIRVVDDSLTVMNDNVFKLDKEFDFVIGLSTVFILRPSGFEFIAELTENSLSRARDKALELEDVITFVKFDTIAEYTATHSRAARLIAAIYIRDDLANINRDKLVQAATASQVELETTSDDKIRPREGHILGFLELLDHRRYTTSLTDDAPVTFVAPSRRPVSATG